MQPRSLIRTAAAVWVCLSLLSAGAVGAAGAAEPKPAGAQVSSGKLVAVDDGEKVTVKWDGTLVCQYIYKGHKKPIIYPINGPHGIGMTRNYPMQKGVEGEATDHPHQASLWFTHDKVNGVGFWNTSDKAGTIVRDDSRLKQWGLSAESNDKTATLTIKSPNKWLGPDGKVICTDNEAIRVHILGDGEIAIDYEKTLHASEGDLTFGDTKEGTMGIRTHPKLRIDKGAKAVNSEGVTGNPIWGKRAKWVDYSAEIDGHVVGVAVFDHPSNPRHPTWWHARAYGLVAANPFGIHDFERKGAGAGDLTLKKGESLTLKYRFLFHNGNHEQGRVADRYEKYAGEKAAE